MILRLVSLIRSIYCVGVGNHRALQIGIACDRETLAMVNITGASRTCLRTILVGPIGGGRDNVPLKRSNALINIFVKVF